MNIVPTYLGASKEYQQGNYLGALRILNNLIDTRKDARTYVLLARTLLKLDLKEEAAASFSVAGKLGGTDSETWLQNAMELYFECGKEDEALLVGRKLVHKARKNPEIAFVLASIFLSRGEREILEGLRKPLLESPHPSHLALAVRLLADSPNDLENLETIRRLFKMFPDNHAIRLLHLINCREFSEFDSIRKHQPVLDAEIAAGNEDLIGGNHPFFTLSWMDDESLLAKASAGTVGYVEGTPERRRARPHAWSDRKIRIGYLSYDFWDLHATMKLLGNVLECHDRERFDITLFCYTPENFVAVNTTDREKWGKVVTIRDMSDAEAAETIRNHNIDILVDLKGHTKGTRTHILNMETAPVHVEWLGFPGTTVSTDVDYIIGDRFVLPEASKPHFHEKFCRLPECYQPNDVINRHRPQPVSRADYGLPDDAFVFASFNGNRKFTPELMEIWSEILKKVRNSVLWIMITDPLVKTNVLKEFAKNGVAAHRIIVAPKVSYEQHLDRVQLADLGLDTWPCNGHTTTSEQLWSGLPVLTVKGSTFAGRVSESLLNAIGVPELVVEDSAAYVDAAIELANNRERLAGYRKTLVDNRFVSPLFDSERFCRHLESAYETMAARARAGEEPDHFDVEALPARVSSFGREELAISA